MHNCIHEYEYVTPLYLSLPLRVDVHTFSLISFQTGRIRDDEGIDTYAGMTEEEMAEAIRKREARSHTQILEMV